MRTLVWFSVGISACVAAGAASEVSGFDLDVSPAEHKTLTDPATGAQLLFLTTDPAADTNLYFHERSWLADSSMILFQSQRAEGGSMAYLTATGELVRLSEPTPAEGVPSGLGAITAAGDRNSVFGTRGTRVVEWALTAEVSPNPAEKPSRVHAVERIVCELHEIAPATSLNESCDGKYLSLGVTHAGATPAPGIVTVDVATGAVRDLYRVAPTMTSVTHVQWSRTNPSLLSFAGVPERLWVIDIRDGSARCPYKQWPDELVTHESWWVGDQILFCGGLHPKPTEDAHVKVLDVHTGVVRIIGAGSWWPEGSDADVAKRNWWHAAGSADGRWVAADNWHGDVALFEGKTTRERRLTEGHRTYGHGEHPHVGWDRKGAQVVFTSHLLGDPNICVATIPEPWQRDNPS